MSVSLTQFNSPEQASVRVVLERLDILDPTKSVSEHDSKAMEQSLA